MVNGVTPSVPVPPRIPDEPLPIPRGTPSIPESPLPVPRAPSVFPQFDDDPLGAIGLVLSNVAAGLQGQELPTSRLRRDQLAQDESDLRRMQIGLQAAGEFARLAEPLDADGKAKLADDFNRRFGEVAGFDFNTLALTPTVEINDVLALAPGIDPSLLTAFRDPAALRDVLLDPKQRAVLEQQSDQKHFGAVETKVQAALDAIEQSQPGFLESVTNAETGLVDLGVAELTQINDQAQLFTPVELATLTRNMQAFGFTPPELSEKVAVGRATEKPLERVEQEAAARARGAASVKGDDAPTFQSPLGKLIGDIETAADQYGVDSPQVAALNEALVAEEKGEKPSFSDVAGLRKEFTKGSGDFIGVRNSFARVVASAENPTAAGDLALIFNYMKVLDPGSVVRESEFAQAAATGSLGSRIEAGVQRVITGERLEDSVRQDFVDRAEMLFKQALRFQTKLEASFRLLADQQGVDPADVVIDFIGDFRSNVAAATAPENISDDPETFGEQLGDMNASQIIEILVRDDLTDAQREAIDKRLKELGG